MMTEKNSYVCVQCGTPAQTLYKRFQNGIVKTSKCGTCTSNVDPYVEYDNVLILLDVLLHKTKAFRHLFFNRHYHIQWRLFLLFALSDTYIRWQCLTQCSDLHDLPFFDWYVIASQQFFTLLGITLCEYLVNSLVTTLLLYLSLCRRSLSPDHTKRTDDVHLQKNKSLCECVGFVVKLLSISSYGKLFNVAAHVWGCEDKLLLVVLTKLFVITSNMQAIFVALPGTKHSSCVVIVAGFLTASAVSWMMQTMLHHFL